MNFKGYQVQPQRGPRVPPQLSTPNDNLSTFRMAGRYGPEKPSLAAEHLNVPLFVKRSKFRVREYCSPALFSVNVCPPF
jgi:hypothetical protein